MFPKISYSKYIISRYKMNKNDYKIKYQVLEDMHMHIYIYT
jgi:hypothetical protein